MRPLMRFVGTSLLVLGLCAISASAENTGGGSLPAFLENLKFSGDFRIRYEGIFDDTAIGNNRLRVRSRLSFKKTFADYASFTFMASSGSAAEPTSTNHTLTGNFTPKTFNIDQAFGAFRLGSGFEILAGKMPVPFLGTDLVWDGDLNPEGLAEHVDLPFAGASGFLQMGQFIFNNSATAKEGYLLGFQAGAAHDVPGRGKLTIAPAYFHILRANATLGVGLNGNLTNAAGTALVSKFQVVELPILLEMKIAEDEPLWVRADVAHNRGANPYGGITYDNGFLLEIGVGRTKKKGDWAAEYRYASIDPDAVLAAFNDSDFSFTDSKGHRARLGYAPFDAMRLAATGLLLESVRDRVRPDRSRIQLDVSLVF